LEEIPKYPGAFKLTRVVDGNDAVLELDGTNMRLFVQQIVVVTDKSLRTDSYSYRLLADDSLGSWLVRWEYERKPVDPDYSYPRAHVHINGHFIDGEPTERVHIAGRRVPLELVVRNLISDWDVKPRTDDWEAVLDESAAQVFDEPI
jgi:hypothetical protein